MREGDAEGREADHAHEQKAGQLAPIARPGDAHQQAPGENYDGDLQRGVGDGVGHHTREVGDGG